MGHTSCCWMPAMGNQSDASIVGRVIWVTRPVNQSANLSGLINKAGGNAVCFPVIEIQPYRVKPEQGIPGSAVKSAHMIVFVSRNAVLYVDKLIPGFFNMIIDKQIVAMGEGTRGELEKKGVAEIIYAKSGVGSEALLGLDEFKEDVIRGKRVVIVRGKGGRDTIEKSLQHLDVELSYLEVYQRVQPVADRVEVEKTWQEFPPDVIVVTSVEGLQNLFNMTDDGRRQQLLGTPLVVMSHRIQKTALDMGFVKRANVALQASDTGLMQAITNTFEVC